MYAMAWLRVGYAREVARAHGILGTRKELPRHALHPGPPPPGVQLFAVSWPWHAFWHPDPLGEQLREMVAILDREEADDEDLVWQDWTSLFQRHLQGRRYRRSASEAELSGHGKRHAWRVFASARVRTIVLPRAGSRKPPAWDEYMAQYGDTLPAICRDWDVWAAGRSHLTTGLCVAELALAAYAHRLLYARGPGNEDVEDMIRCALAPERLADPQRLLGSCKWGGPEDAVQAFGRFRAIVARTAPGARDALGFRRFCDRAQIAWLRVRLVRDWAGRGAFPVPRRQELPAGGFIVGCPPGGCRKFVVSHGWESEMHPSPSGAKMRRLVDALRALEASDDDLVFFDFCSNPQAAVMGRTYAEDEPRTGVPARDCTCGPYFAAHGVAYPLADRSRAQRRASDDALWEMGRLYAFEECEVVVLPQLDLWDFPGGNVWGRVNVRPYQQRGWCCAEFAVARYAGRIANLHDPAVRAVLESREWPCGGTAEACRMYADLMRLSSDPGDDGRNGLWYDPVKGVGFTQKGDREAVKYNFVKMTMALEEPAASDV